jgi:hypothetical protein
VVGQRGESPLQNMSIEKYEHDAGVVSVCSDLKGRHRDHCLFYHCERFKPGTPRQVRDRPGGLPQLRQVQHRDASVGAPNIPEA